MYVCVCVCAFKGFFNQVPFVAIFWNAIYRVLQGVRQSQIPDSYHEKHRDHQEDGKWHFPSAPSATNDENEYIYIL